MPKTKSKPASKRLRPLTYAGQPCTKEQIAGTVKLFRYLRKFVRSAYLRCKHPTQWGDEMTVAQAQRYLTMLVDVAIARKGGMDGSRGRRDTREHETKLFRDQQALQAIVRRRLRVYRFETDEVRRRFGHLLASRDD